MSDKKDFEIQLRELARWADESSIWAEQTAKGLKQLAELTSNMAKKLEEKKSD